MFKIPKITVTYCFVLLYIYTCVRVRACMCNSTCMYVRIYIYISKIDAHYQDVPSTRNLTTFYRNESPDTFEYLKVEF